MPAERFGACGAGYTKSYRKYLRSDAHQAREQFPNWASFAPILVSAITGFLSVVPHTGSQRWRSPISGQGWNVGAPELARIMKRRTRPFMPLMAKET